jgi:uncharacterized protein (DUF433 family)
MNWREYIESDPNILGGKPCVRGTRIPVALIIGYLTAGRTCDEILKEFSGLRTVHVTACIAFASESDRER